MNERIDTNDLSADLQHSRSVRDKMVREMGVTKGCRFNAAKRLESLEKRRTVTIAGASIFVILLSLIPAMVPVPPLLSNLLTLMTVGFSIIILVASILQAANSDSVKSEQLHRCSLDINAIRHELRAINEINEEILKQFSTKYQNVLQKYSVNHDDIDFEKYKLEHPDEYPRLSEKEKTASKKDVDRTDVLTATAGFMAAVSTLAATAALSYNAVSEPIFKAINGIFGP